MPCPVALLFLLLASGAEAFRICAFNAQRLTLTKVAREDVMDTLVRVSSLLKGAVSPKTPAQPDWWHVPGCGVRAE